MTPRENGSEEEPVIRDNRKIDPDTGTVRQNAGGEPADGTAPGGTGTSQAPAEGSAADLLAERTADLQRLQAEYSNYRKRVERDRIAVKEHAVASVLSEFLPVLDDIGRARDHGELTGGFAKVSESLEAAVGKLGLSTYGAKGDAFDPTVHEALLHSYSPDVTEPTCIEILQPGYRIGERILRPARVAVAEPAEDEERVEFTGGDDRIDADGGSDESGDN
ncbi:protein GrpE [Planotetraspora silvatica]|uniref:Protein GrpE n=1 Tax=Planotetraspora silvatica TaxID=234614 RepID=A0A8J3UHS6_9ACTN|nr:nucleotide exchange factor GrpE [Planotetraspora silvatica]GII45548.1 protein GrpE [Planotetraspora silvatica]